MVDPLDDLADFCAEQDLWLHVDGAYGTNGILDPQVSSLFAGLESADSAALDPHKWLATPIECRCAIVREGKLLWVTFSQMPPYLRTELGKGFGGPPWFSEYGFQQTRRFNALKLLWVIQQAGRAGVVAHVARHNRLARYLAPSSMPRLIWSGWHRWNSPSSVSATSLIRCEARKSALTRSTSRSWSRYRSEGKLL